MKKFLKNKFVVLIFITIILSIIYIGANKAIKQYNFSKNDDIVSTESEDAESDNKSEENNKNEVNSKRDNTDENLEDDSNENNDKWEDESIEDYKEIEENENSSKKIYVYITGEVNVPGVLILNENSRIIDAINSAGGTTNNANISKVNLAYILKDGMKVNIPNDNDLKNNPNFEYVTMGSGDGKSDERLSEDNNLSDSSDKGKSTYTKSSLVNINNATQTELETLPGIGPSIALKIINYRNENGKFSSIEDIKNVSGIGDAKFESIKKYITI